MVWYVTTIFLFVISNGVELKETRLEESRLSKVYRDRLVEGGSHFLAWKGQNYPLTSFGTCSLEIANQMLVDFVTCQWESSKDKFGSRKAWRTRSATQQTFWSKPPNSKWTVLFARISQALSGL